MRTLKCTRFAKRTRFMLGLGIALSTATSNSAHARNVGISLMGIGSYTLEEGAIGYGGGGTITLMFSQMIGAELGGMFVFRNFNGDEITPGVLVSFIQVPLK